MSSIKASSPSPPSPAPLSKLLPPPLFDPRYTHRSALLNGYTYSYIHAPAATQPCRGTIVLIHGFPDLSFTWRYQIPHLTTTLNLQVIAPDCLGYGRSDSPPTSTLSAYTYSRIADDIEALCAQLQIPHILLGGHDWGGAIVYRIALLKPQLVRAVVAVCTPYTPPQPTYTPLAQLVATRLPNFAYQLHFASGEIEAAVRSPDQIRSFLNAMYGAKTRPMQSQSQDDGKAQRGEAAVAVATKAQSAFSATGRVRLDLLPQMGDSPLLSPAELSFYTTEYARHGLNGPLNWYRAREANFVAELDLFFYGPGTGADASRKKVVGVGVEVTQPTLFIQATRDTALPESMAANMHRFIPRLTRRRVEAGHWVLWEQAEEVSRLMVEWLGGILEGRGWEGEGGKSRL